MEQIKIQLGSVIMNKTAKFIKPVLRTYGQDFIKKMGAVFKLAYGIGDMYIQKKYEQHLFILIDTKRCINHWIST